MTNTREDGIAELEHQSSVILLCSSTKEWLMAVISKTAVVDLAGHRSWEFGQTSKNTNLSARICIKMLALLKTT